jgi:hypothetical protein
MSETNKNILKQFGEGIIPELQKVSKGFADSIGMEVTDKSLTIYASPFISVLNDGRGPTKSGAKTGSPTLQQSLRSWIDRHSIAPRPNEAGKIPTLDQLSWAMSKSIHLYGDRLYQQGGGKDVFGGIITEDRINALIETIGNKYFNEVTTINLPKIKN